MRQTVANSPLWAIVRAHLIFTVVTVAFFVLSNGHVVAQKAATPKLKDKLALGEEEVKQLLLVMDTDKSGKISKQEWMKFMEAEFDRLDKTKSGELDVTELMQSKLRVSPFLSVGK